MAKKSVLDVLKRILLSFRRNWGLKLISVLFAIILWNYVIVTIDPSRTLTFTDCPVTVTSDSLTQLNNSGLSVDGDINKYLKNVSVTVSITRRDSIGFTRDNIQVTADLSGVTHEGNGEVRLTARTTRGAVQNVYPSSVTVKIQKRDRRVVPVVCVLDGSAPKGYWAGEPDVSPSRLDISGPSANVKLVAKAVVHVDLTNQTSSISAAKDFTLLDEAGNPLDANALGLEFQSNCIVNIQVLPTKTVTIDAKHSLNGSPAWGYELVGDPVVEPAQITVAGPKETLDAMGDALPLGTLDISDAKGNKTFTCIPTLPQDVRFVGGGTVQVLVNVDMILRTVTIDNVHVTVTGLAAGLKVDKTYTVTVTLTCPLLYAGDIRKANLTVTADATGLGAGAHALKLSALYSDPAALVQDSLTSIDPASITITIVASKS